MKTEIVETPEKAFQMNAATLHRFAIEYGTTSLMQRKNCTHLSPGETCDDCRQSADNLLYFSVALAVVAASVVEDKSSELYDLLTRFAAENLPGFPKDLAKHGLYKTDGEFPDVIDG